MIPLERCLVLLGDMAKAFDDMLEWPMKKTIEALGYDYDTPWQPTVEDDQGEALEPESAVVDALRPDTQDRQWRASTGSLWKFEEGRWFRRGPEDYHPWLPTPLDFIPTTSGPFIEILPTVEGEALEPEPLTWTGWAVPAILEVLSEHVYEDFEYDDASCICLGRDKPHLDKDEWREHVAPLIAERIACDPIRAIAALSQKVNP